VSEPALVFGLPLYGRGEHLEEAVESLLAQTRRDVAIVASDDAPELGARAVLERFKDPRITYHANERRLGLVGNWRRAFELARREHPAAPYFAWASDHDAWHPLWAERLIELLDGDPRAVVAYPRTYRMNRDGHTLTTKPWSFDTAGLDRRTARLGRTVRGMSAGNMVYGAYRVEALERAGVFRYALLPDRLLLTELSLQGHLRQAPELLFYRRATEPPSIERQRAAFWPDGAPSWASLPWAWQHVGLLAGALARDGGALGIPPGERARLVVTHAYASLMENLRSAAGRCYYVRIMRRRSVKQLAARELNRGVAWAQGKPYGPELLAAGRRLLGG